MVAELDAALAGIERTPGLRAVVLEGEGPSFCAGADIAWMRALGAADEAGNLASARRMARLFHRLDRLPLPVVGRVHGACFGGGLGLAAACDVVVAERECVFAASEVRLGILPAVVAPLLLAKIGMSRCRELFLSGRRFSAAEALEYGLVHHVVEGTQLGAAVEGVLEELLRGSPEAQAHIKAFLAELARRQGSAELEEWTAGEIARARGSADGRAGLAAFLARTDPPWLAHE
jgi:methylglutaconyl-CoA hydratase